MTVSGDTPDPMARPKTRKKTRSEAAWPWSRGLVNILGPKVMTTLPKKPLDNENKAIKMM